MLGNYSNYCDGMTACLVWSQQTQRPFVQEVMWPLSVVQLQYGEKYERIRSPLPANHPNFQILFFLGEISAFSVAYVSVRMQFYPRQHFRSFLDGSFQAKFHLPFRYVNHYPESPRQPLVTYLKGPFKRSSRLFSTYPNQKASTSPFIHKMRYT